MDLGEVGGQMGGGGGQNQKIGKLPFSWRKTFIFHDFGAFWAKSDQDRHNRKVTKPEYIFGGPQPIGGPQL